MARPTVGQKRADGKRYAGENYGYQSPATYNKLKEQGKFKLGTQALDRVGNAVQRSGITQKVAAAQKQFRNATDKIPGIKQLEAGVNNTNNKSHELPSARVAQGAAIAAQRAGEALNVDPRIAIAGGLLLGRVRTGAQIRVPGRAAVSPTRPQRFTVGNRTQNTPAKRALRAASNTSPAVAHAKNTFATNRTINRQRGSYQKPTQEALNRHQANRAKDVSHYEYDPNKPTPGKARDAEAQAGWREVTPKKPAKAEPTVTKKFDNPKLDSKVRPPRSRTTTPPKHERTRAVKSALRDRGTRHVQQTLRGQNASGQARGDIRSASRNGVGPDPNYGTRRQPRSTTGNTKVEIEGDSRESARNFGRERVAAYNAGDPSTRTPARQKGAQQIINERVANETQGMTAEQRKAFKRNLVRQANAGERKVRAAAEAQYQSTVRRDRFGRSPSTARQNYVPASRDQRRLSDSTRNKMAEAFGKLRKKPLPPPKPKSPVKQYNTPADHARGLQDVKQGFKQAGKVKPIPPKAPDRRVLDKEGNPDVYGKSLSLISPERVRPKGDGVVPNPIRYSITKGDVLSVKKQVLKPRGKTSVPKSPGLSQRRAENLPTPGPITRQQAAARARSQRADKSLRNRNKQGRLEADVTRLLRGIRRAAKR